MKKIFKSALVTSVLYAVAFTMLGGNKDGHFVPFFSIAVFIKTVVVMYVSFLIPVFAIYFSRKKWLHVIAFIAIMALVAFSISFLTSFVEPLTSAFVSRDTLMVLVFMLVSGAYVLLALGLLKKYATVMTV